MKPEQFVEYVFQNAKRDYGIFAPPIKAQDGLNILIKHFLGKDWYTPNPICQEQVNTEAIYEILRRYPEKKRLKPFSLKFWRMK